MKKQHTALALLLSFTVLMTGLAFAEAASAPSVFPIRYDAFGNNYSITGYAIGTGEESGKTEITLFGSGYNKMPLRNGQICVPVWCDFISGGKTYESVSASVSSEKVVIIFDVSLTPESILIQNGDTWDEMAVFDVADIPETKVE